MAATTPAGATTPRVSFNVRRLPFGRIALATMGALVVLMAFPPTRAVAAGVASKAILFIASPLAPDISGFDRLPETSRIIAADGSVLAELDEEKRVNVALGDLPPHVTNAVLAAEDETFYRHSGIEPTAVFRAVVRTAQGDTQGGSTITQQLAKINYTTSERTLFRKLREVLYATRLEREFTKDELLERYLNQVYFGEGAYGIGAAARTYFGTDAAGLTPAQAAFLAGRIRAPEAVDVRTDPDPAVVRRDQVLTNMHQEQWLDDDAFEAATAEPLSLADPQPPEVALAPHFVEYVKREAKGIDALGGSPETRSAQLYTAGYTIETTLDPKAFNASTAAVQEMLGEEGDPTTAVAAVEPGDGAIRNLFGGLTFELKFDVASQGRRQPGSAFKPFVYLAALREGIDPRSTFDASSPQTFEYNGERFEVENYEGEGFGQMAVDDALVHSVNTVFLALGLEAGPRNVMQTALDANAPGDDDAITAVPSIALGGLKEGVTPLEMAAAYATFAAEGIYAEPYSIAKIVDRDGEVLYEHEPETRRIFSATEVGVLNTPMQRVVESGTGQGAAIGRPLAGKTGTTQNYGDAWFVGYVPQLATAVWVGHPDEITPMLDVHGRRVSGGSFPASIFSATMGPALEGVPVERLHTASPDDLDVSIVRPAPSTTSSSSTSTSDTSTTTSEPTTTTSTTQKRRTTTTTEPERESTTTTTAKQKPTTTTTTEQESSTTSTTVQSSSDGDSSSSTSTTTTTTTTAPPPD